MNTERIKTKEVMLPSGFSITLREQTGEDEDTLSRLGDVEDGSSYHKFLSALIIGSSIPDKTRFSANEIAEWPTVDKYYAILESRIHSLGHEMIFDYECTNEKCNKLKTEQIQDLREFTWDLTKGNPPIDVPFLDNKPQLLPHGSKRDFEATTSFGVDIKYNLLTGMGELKTLTKKRKDISRNDELRGRNLAYKGPNGEWIELNNFRLWVSREMKEIRGIVLGDDYNQNFYTTCRCKKCDVTQEIIILTVPDFFFPSGT